MADLLGEIDSNVPTRKAVFSGNGIKSESRRKVRILSPPIEATSRSKSKKLETLALPSPHTADEFSDGENGFLPPLDDGDAIISDPIPSSPVTKAVERRHLATVKVEEEENDDDDMEISQAVASSNSKSASINISGSRPVLKVLKQPPYPTPETSSPTSPPVDVVDATSWNNVTSKLNVLSSPVPSTGYGRIRPEDTTEEDGSIRMFWTDYTEVNGSLCLFGKAKDKSSGAYVSVFVKVDSILRKVFFLPREYKKSECSGHCSRVQPTDSDRQWPRYYRGSNNGRCL